MVALWSYNVDYTHRDAFPPSHPPLCSGGGADDAASENVYSVQTSRTQTGGSACNALQIRAV